MKTLKDTPELHIAGKGYFKGSVDRLLLKENAIKWIDKPQTLHMTANDFILVFFNITEKDLKENLK